MFIIVKDNFVEYGPKEWNKNSFEYMVDILTSKKINLPNENTNVITIDEDCKIYPVIQNIQETEIDIFYRDTTGPFWQFTDTHAIASYNITLASLDKIKNKIKEKIKKNKNKKISFFIVKINVNNEEILFSINEQEKNNIFQKYSIMEDSSVIQWKHSNGWIELSKSNFKELVNAVNYYIENEFIWEKTKCQEIDNCQNIDELKAFVTNEKLL